MTKAIKINDATTCYMEIMAAVCDGQTIFVPSFFDRQYTRQAYSAAFRMAGENGLLTKRGTTWAA
ncbi:hypothetical protein EHS39_11605 [Ensifer sp. MPMI2T]|nr:hypothetical protein EHS39_11605 [Ensifer sp. MPMI2T]